MTTCDVARLQQLRQAQAARAIQRAARGWLKRRRALRAVEEARRKAARIQMMLR